MDQSEKIRLTEKYGSHEDTFLPGMDMLRITNLLKHFIDRSGRVQPFKDLTNTNNLIIYMVTSSDGDVFQRDIEKRLGITRSAASKSVDALVEKGYIVRERVSSDARLKKISLTEKARNIIDEIDREHIRIEKKLLNGFSEEEQDQFREYLFRAEENLL